MIKMLWVGNTARCEQNTGWKPMLHWFSGLLSAISEPFWKLIAVSPRWRGDGAKVVACHRQEYDKSGGGVRPWQSHQTIISETTR